MYFIWEVKKNEMANKTHIQEIKINIDSCKKKTNPWIPKLFVNRNSLGCLRNACLEKHNLDIPYLLKSTTTNTKHYSLKYQLNVYEEIVCAFNECISNGLIVYDCAINGNNYMV
jgi:hypothetical protein